MTEIAYIVGLGARTAIGDSAPMSAASAWAGINYFHQHPSWVDRHGEPMVLAAASYVPATLLGSERYVALGGPALDEALLPLRPLPLARRPLTLWLGLPASDPGTPVELVEVLRRRLKPTGGELRLEAIPQGHASGVVALTRALRQLEAGEELCLVGGIDTYLQPQRLEELDWQGLLKSPANPWGFIPGEAACICALASSRAVREHGLKPLARIVGAATQLEPYRDASGPPCTGQGLTLAMKEALRAVPLGDRIHNIFGDLNGERSRTDEYGFTAVRLAERFVSPSAVHTPADCWGDIGAASAPALLSLATRWGLQGHDQGPLTLIWTSSTDGTRGAIVMDSFQEKRPRQPWE